MVKGAAYHQDMLVLGIITGLLSVVGLPWQCAATVQVRGGSKAYRRGRWPGVQELDAEAGSWAKTRVEISWEDGGGGSASVLHSCSSLLSSWRARDSSHTVVPGFFTPGAPRLHIAQPATDRWVAFGGGGPTVFRVRRDR